MAEQLIADGVDLTKLRGVIYRGPRHPGNTSVEKFLATLEQGGNCQLLALGAVRMGGFYIDDPFPIDQEDRFGSKELWLDTQYTEVVESGGLSHETLQHLLLDGKLHAFDIYFFLPPGVCPPAAGSDIDPELLKKLHVAVWMGFVEVCKGGSVSLWLHNARPGPSALWTLEDFCNRGYSLFAVKRPTCRMPN